MAELQQHALENAVAERRQAAGRGLWAAALAFSAAWAVWLTVSSRRPVPAAAGEPVEAYSRLLAWGRRLGRPISRGETPREYMSGLSKVAETIADRTRWRKQAARRAASVVAMEGALLTTEVERSLFAPAGEIGQLTSRGHRLRSALRELLIARTSGRSGDLSRPTR